MTPLCVCVSTYDVQAPHHGVAECIPASYWETDNATKALEDQAS